MIYLDAGHGGLHPNTKRYMTAPSKLFKHTSGAFHQGPLFFEGVWNRSFADALADRLDNVVKVYHPWQDTPLMDRVHKANHHWLRAGRPESIGLSIHSNASHSHNAAGWEVFTAPGQTRADRFADILFAQVDQIYEGMRQDKSDGDHDKEARLTMCTQTKMPFCLCENLFFDNAEDATLLMDPEFIEKLLNAYVTAINTYFNQGS